MRRKARKLKVWDYLIRLAVFVVIAVLLFTRVDYVRQNVELLSLKLTGRMWQLHGECEELHMHSDSLGIDRRVYVYTPPGYDARDHAKTYPVLYLLHGFPDFGDMGWIKYGRAPQILDEMIVDHKLPPMIMVSPNGEGVGQFGDSEYIDAYNPVTMNRSGAKMESFIAEDLPHWVDAKYHTDAEPSHRWIGGVSTGGYGAINIALHHPVQFGVAISMSGYYEADPSGYARPVWGYHPKKTDLAEESPLEYIKAANDKQLHRSFIYLAYGSNEHAPYIVAAHKFGSQLDQEHIPYVLRSLPGKHSWDLWRSQLIDAVTICAQRALPHEMAKLARKVS